MIRNKLDFKKIKMLMAGIVACSVIAINVTASTAFAYDREKAVKYADDYCKSTNSEYDSFSGGDCTNYASQVLKAGGYSVKAIPSSKVSYFDLGGTKETTEYWCNKKYTKKFGPASRTDFVTTTTWSCVDQLAGEDFYGLQDYMVNKLGKTRLVWGISDNSFDKLAKEAHEGDIIQIAKAGSRFSHSYVVGKVKNGKVYVYAHTGNRDATDDDELHKMKRDGAFDKYVMIALIQA